MTNWTRQSAVGTYTIQEHRRSARKRGRADSGLIGLRPAGTYPDESRT